MFLRQLEYLAALARERHFGRAAGACHVSQPALSAALRKLEQELGVTLIYRDQHRFDDLTPEGYRILGWAQQAVGSVEGLRDEAARIRSHLTGTLRLGVIPTALPAVSLILTPLLDRHPAVFVHIRSLSSIEIERQLGSHDLDAGLTYLDNEPLGAVSRTPIYEERYVFLTDDKTEFQDRETISWAETANVPLCLLSDDMQNRRIIDKAFRDAGVEARPRVEANSITALLSFATHGWSCVIAHTWLVLHGLPAGMRGLRLIDPDVRHTIGLVTRDGALIQPIARALRDELSTIDMDLELARRAHIDADKQL